MKFPLTTAKRDPRQNTHSPDLFKENGEIFNKILGPVVRNMDKLFSG